MTQNKNATEKSLQKEISRLTKENGKLTKTLSEVKKTKVFFHVHGEEHIFSGDGHSTHCKRSEDHYCCSRKDAKMRFDAMIANWLDNQVSGDDTHFAAEIKNECSYNCYIERIMPI